MIHPREVARHHPRGERAVFTGDRGTAVTEMAVAFEHFVARRRDLGGLISAGGSGGTALATQAMRRLPIGVPKVMVSTVASGDVRPYVGPSDICMMYSVTDVSGINRISERVLANAAHALAGMIAYARSDATQSESKPAIGLTMFGLTTTCVQAVTKQLEERYDCLVFHATGTGGQSMEKLVDSGLLAGVIDVTTTEITDEIVGGVLSAGPARLDAVIARARSLRRLVRRARHGQLLGDGHGARALPRPQAPPAQPERHADAHHARRGGADRRHSSSSKLNRMDGPVRFLIPEGGVSAIDAPDQPFWDPAADQALFDAIASDFRTGANRRLVRLPHHINDPAFADALVAALQRDRPGARERAGAAGLTTMPRIARQEILAKFRDMIAQREPIIGGGAGTGLSAKCEEAGGIDLIVIYNSGRYRMAGRGSLAGLMAYGNANEIVVDMAREVLPVVKRTPVLAGVNGTDPFMITDHFLRHLADLGFSGIQNFPTVGLFDGVIRAQLEETGMGYGLEVDMIRAARALDLLTTPYVFSEQNAARHGAGRRRHRRLPPGTHHRRRDRRRDRADARRLRADSINAWAAAARDGQPGRDRALPRRADRAPRGRRVHPAALPGVPRLLRRLQHGAAADRGGADRDDPQVQGDQAIAPTKATAPKHGGAHHDRRPIRNLHPRPHRRRDRRRDRRLAAALAVPALVEGAGVRAHRPRRPEGGDERRRASCCRSSTR